MVRFTGHGHGICLLSLFSFDGKDLYTGVTANGIFLAFPVLCLPFEDPEQHILELLLAIPQEIIESIRQRVSLEELASGIVELKPSGRNLIGLCPFHQEKTPSFYVRREEGTYHCFGCGKSGSVFDFVMETRGLSFVEAVHYLASKIGIRIPSSTTWSDKSRQVKEKRARGVRELLSTAQKVYSSVLAKDILARSAREYLSRRGISEETARRFFLGYAPRSWEFIRERVAEVFPEEGLDGFSDSDGRLVSGLVEAGLIKPRSRSGRPARAAESLHPSPGKGETGSVEGADEEETDGGGFYDVFRGRLIFPISRSDGAPIAFGGRVIEERADVPKYINSAESLVYAKRRTFYGLSQALPAMRKNRHTYLVEGYLDVLSMSQLGFVETLATCGTAITDEHAQVLKRFVDRVTVIFDGDPAGRRAAAHCFPVFLNTGIEVSVILLDDGEDPDSMAQSHSRTALEEIFARRRLSLICVYIDQLFQRFDTAEKDASAVVRGKVATHLVKQVLRVKNAVERETLIVNGAELIGVSKNSVAALLREQREREVMAPVLEEPTAGEHLPRRRVEQNTGKSTFQHRGTEPVATKPILETDQIGTSSQQNSCDLSPYCRQLVVAVLIDPLLAQTVLELPSLVEGVKVVDSLPNNLRDLFCSVADSHLTGLAAVENEGEETVRKGLEGLLGCHGLGQLGLVEEALNQLRVGGAEPAKLVREAGFFLARRSLSSEVAHLREAESTESDGERLAKLAQQKLEKRRDLERLQGTEKGRDE